MARMDTTDRRIPPTVVLGITGGIAAYKAAELTRALVKHGCRIKVVMTASATRFVAPLTFRTLTNQPVATSLWEDEPGDPVHHISLAEEAEVMVIAPCTANVLAKLAHGRADDLLTTTALATEAPLVIAPAMNVHMWRKEVTRENVEALRRRGVVFVEPAYGELACGEVGEGRLAAVEDITAAVLAQIKRSRSLVGVRMIVTAAGTQEPIDPVRYIGNRGSGRTGFAIAEEASRRGAQVTLVAGPTHLPDPFGVRTVRVTTAAQMREAVMDAYPDADVVVATAAVADFAPAEPSEGKVKKESAPDAVALVRTADILAERGEDKGDRVLVGFKAETGNPLPGARACVTAKHLDMLVANDVSIPGLGFGQPENRVWFVSATGAAEELPVLPKSEIARRLLDRVGELLGRDR
jgi:phosphopantothenoylcysteine decarboxylase/phosphopantothenate--cysteine ligase